MYAGEPGTSQQKAASTDGRDCWDSDKYSLPEGPSQTLQPGCPPSLSWCLQLSNPALQKEWNGRTQRATFNCDMLYAVTALCTFVDAALSVSKLPSLALQTTQLVVVCQIFLMWFQRRSYCVNRNLIIGWIRAVRIASLPYLLRQDAGVPELVDPSMDTAFSLLFSYSGMFGMIMQCLAYPVPFTQQVWLQSFAFCMSATFTIWCLTPVLLCEPLASQAFQLFSSVDNDVARVLQALSPLPASEPSQVCNPCKILLLVLSTQLCSVWFLPLSLHYALEWKAKADFLARKYSFEEVEEPCFLMRLYTFQKANGCMMLVCLWLLFLLTCAVLLHCILEVVLEAPLKLLGYAGSLCSFAQATGLLHCAG